MYFRTCNSFKTMCKAEMPARFGLTPILLAFPHFKKIGLNLKAKWQTATGRSKEIEGEIPELRSPCEAIKKSCWLMISREIRILDTVATYHTSIVWFVNSICKLPCFMLKGKFVQRLNHRDDMCISWYICESVYSMKCWANVDKSRILWSKLRKLCLRCGMLYDVFLCTFV